MAGCCDSVDERLKRLEARSEQIIKLCEYGWSNAVIAKYIGSDIKSLIRFKTKYNITTAKIY